MHFIRSEMRNHAKGQLTVPQFRILLKLNRHENITHREVADWLGVTPATLTRMIDTLVDRKLAIRQIAPQDRRKIRLVATQKGKAISQKYRERVNCLIQDKIEALNRNDKTKLFEGILILSKLFPEAD